ncbi:MAG: ECF transporter S component, partial [Atopobium sp.]|nr:ECF transporter S component [Atopobium sp.]
MASSHSTHATTASSNGWSTKRIAILAMLCAAAAISTMVLQFPLIPGVTFLKYDPSGVFALLAGVAFGPAAGAIVSVLPYLLHLTTESGIYGTIMAILATLTYVLPVSLIVYNRS